MRRIKCIERCARYKSVKENSASKSLAYEKAVQRERKRVCEYVLGNICINFCERERVSS